MPRKILHIDMDAFYASVEQRDAPELRGKTVVVARRGARSVVCAASYEARTFGVRSALPALQAERLCPQAVFVDPDFPRYKEVSKQVRAIFARHTDLIEPLSLDEAYLDVTMPKQDLGSATAVAESIRADIRNELHLTASAGVAPNKFVAKIASDFNKPDGICVVKPHQVDAFVAALPLARVPGVGRVTSARLAKLGLQYCRDVRTVDVGVLEQHFGRWGRRLHELSFGIDERPVCTERATLQVSSEDTLREDVTLAELTPHIHRMAEKTWAAYLRELKRHPEREAHTVILKLKTSQFRTLTRSLTLRDAPADAEALKTHALELCARVSLPANTLYRLVGVGMAGFLLQEMPQPALFPSGQTLATRLSNPPSG